MNQEIEILIDKTEIVREMAQSHEVKQVCNLLIDLAEILKDKNQLGFTPDESQRHDKSKERDT